MPLLLLIRHGENDFVKTGKMAGHTPGVHLNERGQQQAAELGETLKDVPLAAIYSSPLERAVETAEPIAHGRELQIQVRPGLIESHVGEWQGSEMKHLRKLPEWKIVQNQPSRFRFPGGESFQEMQTRLVTEVETIVKSHQPEDIVALVFHSDPIKLVIAYYLGMPLDNFQRLSIDTASVTMIYVSPTGVSLVKQNLRPPFKFPLPEKRPGKQSLLQRILEMFTH
jgi:probable phosphomutase (TIGR03848 family)